MMKYNTSYNDLGDIHKLRHTLRWGGRGYRSVTLCDKEGRDPKFCDIAFQNSIKAIYLSLI